MGKDTAGHLVTQGPQPPDDRRDDIVDPVKPGEVVIGELEMKMHGASGRELDKDRAAHRRSQIARHGRLGGEQLARGDTQLAHLG